MNIQSLKSELNKNPEFTKEYEKLKPEFEITRTIINARISQKLT